MNANCYGPGEHFVVVFLKMVSGGIIVLTLLDTDISGLALADRQFVISERI